jgi:hypothetical protein
MADLVGTGGVLKPATAREDMGPTSSTFDISDRPSMGDLTFVEGKVREMVKELHDLCHDGKPHEASEFVALVEKWTRELSPSNTAYIQTLSPESLAAFLKKRGLGTEETDPDGPLRCLLAETLGRYLDATTALQEGKMDEEMWEFAIDTAIEDCTYFLVGLDNPVE